MKQLKLSAISATVHHGEKVVLTNFWQDSNVICPNSKIFYVTDGEIVLKIKDQTIIAAQGDMVIIPAGTKHDFHLSDKQFASKYWLHTDLFIGGNNLFDYYPLPFMVHVGQNDYLCSLFDTVLKLKDSAKLSDKLIASSTLLNIVAFYADCCGMKEKVTSFDEIDRAVNFINDNYSEKFTLDQLCRYVNLSKGYFVRQFKKRTGYSPMHYVNVLKIDKAKTMLEQSNRSINDIMEELGFYDSAHFSKLFKSFCGYSPKRFREVDVYRKQNKPIK